jgi:hypothetical protein
MTLRITLSTTLLLATLAPLTAQDAKESPVMIRTVVADPVKPVVDLFARDGKGSMAKLAVIADNLPEPQQVTPLNGSVVIYQTASPNPQKPMEGVAATARIPEKLKRFILVLVPSRDASGAPYRSVVIDDSASGFPKGESRVLSLVPVETAIEAGEHKLPIPPGKVTRVPVVRKVNEFNMAQTNFYYREGETWVPFTERQLQYLDDFRRVFVIHVSPGATFPMVSTLLDTAPAAKPAVKPE